jgi:dipeptidyl aminopeptidase/acylaminoacyl peptidase
MSPLRQRYAAPLHRLVRWATASVALFTTTAACAQASGQAPAEAPVAIERFFQLPAVLSAELSPSGRHVALTTSRGSNRVDLMVMELGDQPSLLRVAHFDDADVIRFAWVNDARLVFSLGDLQAGAQHRAPGLYSVGTDGKQFTMLIRRFGTQWIADGTRRVETLDWNHHLLTVPRQHETDRPDDVVVGKVGLEGRTESIEPMWLNTRTGSTRPMVLPGAPREVVRWWFDSTGNPRAAATEHDNRGSLYSRGPSGRPWRRLAEFDRLHAPYWPLAVRDDGELYVTQPRDANGVSALFRFDFETMAPARAPLLAVPGFDFEGELLSERAQGPLLGVRLNADSEVTVWFDDEMKRFQAAADQRLPGRVNSVQCRRCGASDMVALVRSYSDRDPGRLLLYEAARQRWQTLSAVLDGVDPTRMANVDFQRIKARDGLELPVWLTLPRGRKPAPSVVLVHGGPWTRGGYWRWEAMAQFLASRGYLVISPEFRGSTGYGESHFQAGFKQWGRSMQDDVADALLWAQSQGLASKRACIAGASYGGYAALMGLVRHPELYRCGIAWVAVTDPFLFLQGSWWLGDDISGQARRYLLPELVGNVESDSAALTEASPLAQAARIRAPLLLGYGEKDLRVPLTHGERLREALQKAGQPPEWVSYPDEGHGWRQVSTQVDFARRMEDFLKRHLDGNADR